MKQTGISNRETPREEQRERQEHPPLDSGSPPPQDAAGRVGEEPLAEVPNRQTSHKAGSRSIAQKEDLARYPDRSMPPTRKVSGAFGREPREIAVEPAVDTRDQSQISDKGAVAIENADMDTDADKGKGEA